MTQISTELKNLVFGMNDLDKIVSIETKDDKIIAFREENGVIEELTDDNIFWILTNEKVSSKQETLDGDQHYKYIAKFSTKQERDKVVNVLKKNEVDFYRVYDPKEQSLIFQGITYFKGLSPKDVSILSFDIETTGLLHDDNAKILLISNTYRNQDKLVRKLFAYDEYKNQGEMIKAWCKWVREVNPSIMCGHNIYGFDIPYMNYIARKNNVYLKLGRDGSSVEFDKWESSFRKDGSQDIDYTNCHIYGREIVDTMFLSYKYDFKREFESYGLKPIIRQLGMEKQGRTFVDGDQIRFKYKDPETWKLIKQYAIEDADDSLKLFDKMIPAYFYFNQSCSKTFQQIINSATGSQINNMMVRSYLQKNHSIAKGDEATEYAGAISFGIPGIYRNCFKQDVASLYPSIMRQYKIYPEGKDPDKHFLKMLDYFTLERLANKKRFEETKEIKYEQLSEAQKIVINSMYGFLGTSHLNYNYPKGAALVTDHGRVILSVAVKYATNKPIEYWKGLSENE